MYRYGGTRGKCRYAGAGNGTCTTTHHSKHRLHIVNKRRGASLGEPIAVAGPALTGIPTLIDRQLVHRHNIYSSCSQFNSINTGCIDLWRQEGAGGILSLIHI